MVALRTGQDRHPAPGVYAITAAVRWAGSPIGTRRAGIVLDDAVGTPLTRDVRDAMPGGGVVRQPLVTVRRLAAGDHVVLQVSQDSGDGLEVFPGAPGHLAASWIAP